MSEDEPLGELLDDEAFAPVLAVAVAAGLLSPEPASFSFASDFAGSAPLLLGVEVADDCLRLSVI